MEMQITEVLRRHERMTIEQMAYRLKRAERHVSYALVGMEAGGVVRRVRFRGKPHRGGPRTTYELCGD